MFASALDQCRWSDFWFWEFLENEQQFSLFDWLIDVNWLISKCDQSLLCSPRRSKKLFQVPVKVLQPYTLMFSCGYLAGFILVTWIDTLIHDAFRRFPRCEFVGCGACSQGIRQAELCCNLALFLAPMDHLGNGQDFFLAKIQFPQIVGFPSLTLNMRKKDQTIQCDYCWFFPQWGCCVHVLLPGMTHLENAEVMWRHYSLPSCSLSETEMRGVWAPVAGKLPPNFGSY